jgi:hypothetical protein
MQNKIFKRKFYLLDRNVISITKDSNIGKHQVDKEKIEMLHRLKSIDRRRSFVSPLFSIIEGQTGGIESKELSLSTIEREASEIKKFFKLAHTDSDLFFNIKENLAYVISEIHRENKKFYDFVECVSPLILEPVGRIKRDKVKNEITAIARKNDISLTNHVVICCLSVLYGGKDARNILKPKKDKQKIHNSVSDLLILSKTVHILALSSIYQEPIKYEFISLDRALNSFFALITVKNAKPIPSGSQATLYYDRKLFPDLINGEYESLMIELGAKFD